MPREAHDNGVDHQALGVSTERYLTIADSPGRSVEVVLPASLLNDILGLALLDETSPADQIRSGIRGYCARRIATDEILELVAEARGRIDESSIHQRSDSSTVRGRSVVLHIPELDFDTIRGLALVDQTSIATVIRTATSEYVDIRLRDPELNEKFDSERRRDRTALEDVAAVVA